MSDTHSLQDPFDTPDHAKGSSVNQQLTSIIHGFGNANDDQEPDAKRAKYLKITPAQLSQLITACSTPGISPMPHPNTSPTTVTAIATTNATLPYVQNAKYEDICCRPIKPTYDGSEANLMPFLLRLDIRRQDEGWASATYLVFEAKTYDLTTQFALVTEAMLLASAAERWDAPTVDNDKHTIGHTTCSARLLANAYSLPFHLI